MAKKSFPPNRIRELRKNAGLTTVQLARLIGTSNQNLGQIELSQKGLRSDWLHRIAKVLGVPPRRPFWARTRRHDGQSPGIIHPADPHLRSPVLRPGPVAGYRNGRADLRCRAHGYRCPDVLCPARDHIRDRRRGGYARDLILSHGLHFHQFPRAHCGSGLFAIASNNRLTDRN